MNRVLILVCAVLTGCMTQDPAVPGRHVEFVSPKAAPVPHAKLTLSDDIDFALPVRSLVYKKINVHLPRGCYELLYVDDEGYYFYAQDGRLTMTGDGNSWAGGVFVPKEKNVIWRVWQVRGDPSTAFVMLGPLAAGVNDAKIMRHDIIPDEIRQQIDVGFRAAIEANQSSTAQRH